MTIPIAAGLDPGCGSWLYPADLPVRDAGFDRDRQMAARIYKPAKTAMQSGYARMKEWVLEFEPAAPREIDPLMGWTSSADMTAQLKLEFDSREDAIAYAERNGIPYAVHEPKARKPIRKSYADNFKFGRLRPWTH